MLLIWFLLAVVYTKANVVGDRKEGGPTSYMSTFEFKRKQSILSERNKCEGVKPVKKYNTLPIMLEGKSIPHANIDVHDSKSQNSKNSSEKNKRNHRICTTPPKLLSKSNQTRNHPESSYDSHIVQGSVHINSTSSPISEKRRFLPEQQKGSSSSMSSDGEETSQSDFIKGMLKNRFPEMSKTELDVNQSKNIDLEFLNLRRNERAAITTHTTLIKYLESGLLLDMSKKVPSSVSPRLYEISETLTTQRPRLTSYNGTKTKKKIANKEFINRSPNIFGRNSRKKYKYAREFGVITSKNVHKNSAPEMTLANRKKIKRSRDTSGFETAPEAFVNPGKAQIIVNHPSQKRVGRRRKRGNGDILNPTTPMKIDKSHYDEFDWYKNDDGYGLTEDGASEKIELSEEDLKEFESIVPVFFKNNTGQIKNGNQTITFSVQYPSYIDLNGNENESSTETYEDNKDEWEQNYPDMYEEKDLNVSFSEAASGNKYWLLQESKEDNASDVYVSPTTAGSQNVVDALKSLKKVYSQNIFGPQSFYNTPHRFDRTTSDFTPTTAENITKNKAIWANWALPMMDKGNPFVEFYWEPTTTSYVKYKDPSGSLWNEILYLPDFSYGTEPSRKVDFIKWRKLDTSKDKSTSKGFPLFRHYLRKNTEDENELRSSSTGLFYSKKGTKGTTDAQGEIDLPSLNKNLYRQYPVNEMDQRSTSAETEKIAIEESISTPDTYEESEEDSSSTADTSEMSEGDFFRTADTQAMSEDETFSIADPDEMPGNKYSVTADNNELPEDEYVATADTDELSEDESFTTADPDDISEDETLSTPDTYETSEEEYYSTVVTDEMSEEQSFPTADTPERPEDQSFLTADTPELPEDQSFPTADIPELLEDQSYLTADTAEPPEDQSFSIANTAEPPEDQTFPTADTAEMPEDQSFPTADTDEMPEDEYISTADTEEVPENEPFAAADTEEAPEDQRFTAADTEEIPKHKKKEYYCTCTREVEEYPTDENIDLSPESEQEIYNVFTDPNYNDLISQGFYEYDRKVTEISPPEEYTQYKGDDSFYITIDDPYDDYNKLFDNESYYEFYKNQRMGNDSDNNFEDYESPYDEVEERRRKKGRRCSGVRILPSCIILICMSWLRYCTSLPR